MRCGNLTAVATKIRKVGNAYLASTGWGVYDDIFDDYLQKKEEPDLSTKLSIFRFFQGLWQEMHKHYSFVNDQCQEDDSPFGDLDASFLVVCQTGIFKDPALQSITQTSRHR